MCEIVESLVLDNKDKKFYLLIDEVHFTTKIKDKNYCAIASIKNEKVNPALVSSYIDHIMASFLVNMAKRYDVKGKKLSVGMFPLTSLLCMLYLMVSFFV